MSAINPTQPACMLCTNKIQENDVTDKTDCCSRLFHKHCGEGLISKILCPKCLNDKPITIEKKVPSSIKRATSPVFGNESPPEHPFFKAVKNNDLAYINGYFAHNTDINTDVLPEKNRPLHIAAEVGNLELIDMFLKKGASVNIQNEFGETPLHRAVFKNKLNAVKMLVENGADVNMEDSFGIPPISEANNEIGSYLVENGASEDPLENINERCKVS